MIARALAQRPQVMLLDEITAFLDLPSRVTITSTLRRLAHETGVSIILSSHDLELSLNAADRIWLLPGDGRFEDGAPEDVALSGAIGKAFDQSNLVFSLQSGRFETRDAPRGQAFVEARGATALWLKRAMERMGFVAGGVEAEADVVIREVPEGYSLDGVAYPSIRELGRAFGKRA